MKTALTTFFVFLFFAANCQNTIYYNDEGEITLKEMSTHYRIAQVDTATRIFTGIVNEYRSNHTLLAKMKYDRDGQLTDTIRYYNENETLQFEIPISKFRKLPERIKTLLKIKGDFKPAKYIRKNDYPALKNILTLKSRYNASSNRFQIVEEHTYFPGGMEALGQFIGIHLEYPKEAADNHINGIVNIKFTVLEDGTLSDFEVISGIGYGCDAEAMRVMKQLPDWVPAYQRGKAVPVTMSIPLTFQ